MWRKELSMVHRWRAGLTFWTAVAVIATGGSVAAAAEQENLIVKEEF